MKKAVLACALLLVIVSESCVSGKTQDFTTTDFEGALWGNGSPLDYEGSPSVFTPPLGRDGFWAPNRVTQALGLWLISEIVTYLLFRRRVRRLAEIKASHAAPDARYVDVIERIILEEQTADDVRRFLSYAFFSAVPVEKISRSVAIDWLSRHIACRERSERIILKVEDKLGFKFAEAQSPITITPDTGWIFGNAPVEAHYRPLMLVFFMRLTHCLNQILLKIMGFTSFSTLEGMKYYVWLPGGSRQIEKRPLVILHGFGFGLIPYMPLIVRIWAHGRFRSPGRPLVLLELQWLGMMPLGNIYSKESISELMWDAACWLAGDTSVLMSGSDNKFDARGRIFDFLVALGGFADSLPDSSDRPCTDDAAQFKDSLTGFSVPKFSDVSDDLGRVVDHLLLHRQEKTIDIIAHSFGTAILSNFYSSHSSIVSRVVMMDPICFIPQLTKKAQLVHCSPWDVVLYDRPQRTATLKYSMFAKLYESWHDAVDQLWLYLYWYIVFRDFGTVWTACRQLNGPDYVDLDRLCHLGNNIMVVLSERDLITAPDALHQFFQRGQSPKPVMKMCRDHHGVCVVNPLLWKEVIEFVA